MKNVLVVAELKNGLLSLELERPKQTNVVRTITIRSEAVQPSDGNDNKKE